MQNFMLLVEPAEKRYLLDVYSNELRCDSSSARQWTQRRGVGRLKHVDVRLCQLQDWVRDDIVKLGTVKTALNVADLNTTKLSCARRAFLLCHLSQVEYFEGEEIVRTGEDEYDKYEQEKRLKEYVGGNQVKNLIRLIQVFSVIRPSTASWIKGSPVAVETGEASGNSHTMERLDITYILLVIAVAVLIVPRILEAWKRITKLIARMSTVGMVKIHSGSRNKVFHKETCRYVQGQPRTGMFYYLSSEEAREQGYRPCYTCWPETRRKVVSGSSFGRGRNKMDKDLVVSSSDESWEVTEEENEVCSKVCYWCEQRKCSRKKVGHVWCSYKAVSESMQQRSGEQPTTRLQMKERLETIAGTKAMRKDRQKDKVERGCKEKAACESVERQVEAEQQWKERSAKEQNPERKDCRKSQKTRTKTRCQRTPTRKRELSTTDKR